MMKNMVWLRNLKKELGSQCHGRRCRVWRWEQAVAQCVGTDWTNVAHDRMGWRTQDECDDEVEKTKMADRIANPIE